MQKRWLILALALGLLGAWMRFVFTPMRFCGVLLLAAAAFSLLWGWLTAHRERKLCRWLRRSLGVLLAVGLGVFAVLEGMVIAGGHTDVKREPQAVVLLGAGVNGTTPSLSLLVRLEAALTYIQDKPDIPLVVSGCQGPGEDISEAACMANWLVDHGVRKDRILLEDRAANTRENIAFSQEMLRENGVDLTGNVAVVTADYHLRRAEHYWGVPGMVPVAAHLPTAYWYLTLNYTIREAFALAYAMLIPGR